jgi:hypothetical protein
MDTLSVRSARLAHKLAVAGFALLALSALVLAAMPVLRTFLLVPLASLPMLGAVAVSSLSLFVRRRCLNPRPVAPVLAFLLSAVGLVCYGTLLVNLFPGPNGH